MGEGLAPPGYSGELCGYSTYPPEKPPAGHDQGLWKPVGFPTQRRPAIKAIRTTPPEI